jgi:uncharacterized protein YceK
MRIKLVCLAVLLALSGCISLGGGSSPPQHTTIVVPPGLTTCTSENRGACQ